MLPVAAIALSLAACGDDDIDNAASRNLSVIQITPSADYIKLDETKPDEVALTLEWSPAHNYGNEYITTYEYEMQLDGSAADKLHEYEDDAVFRRSYTNKELQDMLVDKFGQTTSTLGTMISPLQHRLTALVLSCLTLLRQTLRLRPMEQSSSLPTRCG